MGLGHESSGAIFILLLCPLLKLCIFTHRIASFFYFAGQMPTLSTLLAKDYALLSDAEKRRMRKLDRKGRVKRHNDMTKS